MFIDLPTHDLSIQTLPYAEVRLCPDDLDYAAIVKKYSNNPNGWPPLNYAIQCKDVKAVDLLSKHVNVNLRAPMIIKWDYDANPVEWEQDGETPLDAAIRIRNLEIIDILLTNGADPTIMRYELPNGTTAIFDVLAGYYQSFGGNYIHEGRGYAPGEETSFFLEILKKFKAHKVDFSKICVSHFTSNQTPLQLAHYWWKSEPIKYNLALIVEIIK